MADDYMVVQLYCSDLDEVISSVEVPSGSFACLTGVIDLPAGEHNICIRLYPKSWEGWGQFDGAGLQVIVGQTVSERGCEEGGAGCS